MKRNRQKRGGKLARKSLSRLKNLSYPAKKPVLKRDPTWLVRTFDGSSPEG
jgi:hypothetical protein